MVQDLKADSANFERSGDTGSLLPDRFGLPPSRSPNFSIGRYESSMVHRSRQHWGPSTEQTSTPTDRQTSRADSDSTNYSRTTTSSYNSNPQYSSTPSYGYETQYSRGEREQEPSRGHQQTPRDPYLAYAGAQPSTYGGGNAAIPSGDNYTHHPSTHQSQATGIPYGYTQETGYGRAAPDYTSQAPRSSAHQTPYPGGPAGHGSGYATGGHSAHTSRYFGSQPPEYLVYH